uniref:Tc1-like transposase DDE domain-containing protein n=1 Tax=Trichogramma kaykai TaxID=54128 RepID=A0ABD2VUI6_9HYME
MSTQYCSCRVRLSRQTVAVELSYWGYDEKYILPRSWNGRATKCFFGFISGYGPGSLVPEDRRLNSDGYLDLLEEIFVPTIRAIFGDEEVINVIEDDSAVYTAHIVRDWWRNQPQFNRLDLPARSPEINIIETTLQLLTRRRIVASREAAPVSPSLRPIREPLARPADRRAHTRVLLHLLA